MKRWYLDLTSFIRLRSARSWRRLERKFWKSGRHENGPRSLDGSLFGVECGESDKRDGQRNLAPAIFMSRWSKGSYSVLTFVELLLDFGQAKERSNPWKASPGEREKSKPFSFSIESWVAILLLVSRTWLFGSRPSDILKKEGLFGKFIEILNNQWRVSQGVGRLFLKSEIAVCE